MEKNPMTLVLEAKVVGRIDLSKYTKTTTFDKPKPKDGEVSKADLDALEKVLDRLFAHYKIDISFTKHFKDRMNDARNVKQITISELNALFQKAHSKLGGTLAKQKDIEAVLTDLQSKVNVPFVLKSDGKGGLELVAKTVMRKKDFKTSNKKFTVEMKSFKTFLGEMMQPDAIKQDAADAADYIKNEMQREFAGQEVVSYLSTNLGPSIVVGVYKTKKGGSKIDMMNAPSNVQFIKHLTDGFGRALPMSKFSFEKNIIRSDGKKVAYRKITGNSPMDAAKKLVAWIKKNFDFLKMVDAPAR